MKKVLSLIVAVAMILTVSVAVFADEVLYSEDLKFFSAGNWESTTLEDNDAFLEALQVEGAVLTITRSNAGGIEAFGDNAYEKFALNTTWYSCTNSIMLGTAGHTAADEPDAGIIDCISDDGLVCTYDANAVYDAFVEEGGLNGGSVILISNTSASGFYDITNISVVVPDAPTEPEDTTEEAPADETPAEDTASEEAPAASTTTSSPNTGVALCFVPMAIAALGAVASKRR